MDEASAQSQCSVSNADLTNSEVVGDEAENIPTVKEVQTGMEHKSKLAQTNWIEVCNRDVQTENDEFFAEKNFLSDDAMIKVEYYTGLPNGEVLLLTFEFVMKSFANGEKDLITGDLSL